jgi:hypothetical protein
MKKWESEFEKGSSLSKCQKCGCRLGASYEMKTAPSFTNIPMRKILTLLCGLLIYCSPVSAQEFYLLGGALGDTASSNRSYTWSLEYMQGLGEYTAISISWLNEGHLPNNHRDGIMAQFWGRTKIITMIPKRQERGAVSPTPTVWEESSAWPACGTRKARGSSKCAPT